MFVTVHKLVDLNTKCVIILSVQIKFWRTNVVNHDCCYTGR